MSDLLFAAPWWMVALLAVIGVVLIVNGIKSQVTRVRNVGAGVILLALVWGLLWLVDTDKKRVERGTREFVKAAVDGDWPRFKSYLTPSSVVIAGEHQEFTGADQITARVKGVCESGHLKSANIRNLTLEQTGPAITVHFDLYTQQEALPPATTSSWEFRWERSGQTWLLREIRLITLNGMPASQLREAIPK